ncbi:MULTISPECIES: NADP-dependent oxidoreductase [Arthrobacter]|uniref:NADP-dependent oxidoreductase n=2 Tax=Arthrobacter TaxID=1663 RepID=A0ABU9KFH8_9MICC|nr:NADP-dependent oxidoreductase [Arthrobacter sp. YJM1]MDP5225635.1 NADP-dependent oxidoreductase [Arthrobacter sp. YJM1]
MRAAVYDHYSHDLSGLTVREVPEPKVFPGSVLIEVRAAGVNPVDWKLMAGYLDGLIDAQFPVIPGWDVAGVVVGVGFDTPEFAVGDEVMAYARKDVLGAGTFAERVAVPVHAVTRKPASLSWEQAGGLPLAGGTALRTIDSLGELGGKTLLVHGAAGGVGALAVQIAVNRGARVIGTASAANHDYLRTLGAAPVQYGLGLAHRVMDLAGGPVDAVADFVGGQLETTLAVLREGGSHASIADGTVTEHGGHHLWVRPDGSQTARLADLAEKGLLHVEIAQTFPLDGVADAFRASQSGHTRGKLIIVP